MITVLLVDDQPAVRQGLAMRLGLEPDLAIVGEAGDGEMALRLACTLDPDVVVMDIEMPRLDGIRATAALRTLAPRSAVVILSLRDHAAVKSHAMAAGALAFVGKHDADASLLDAIRQVAGMARVERPEALTPEPG